VKIKGTCKRDGRELMAELAIANGGVCPWDGEPFTPDYTVILVDALRDAEAAGTKLERALTVIADVQPDLTLDEQTVLGDLNQQLARLRRNLVRQG
jgi:hypothetical protein